MQSNPLEQRIGQQLIELGQTLTTAESCTGGLVSWRITTVPGSSEYFLGGIVAYSNEWKSRLLDVPDSVLEQYGAVSRECAEAMAAGARARSNADIAVSTTGIAGPGGATDTKPVGLIYIACQTPENTTVQELRLGSTRREHMEQATDATLQMLWDQLNPDGSSN